MLGIVNHPKEVDGDFRLRRFNLNISFIYIFSVLYAFLISGLGKHGALHILTLLTVIFYIATRSQIRITIRTLSVLYALAITAAFALLNYVNFSEDLNGDQFYHLNVSYYLATTAIKKYAGFLSNYTFLYILSAYSIAVTASIIFLHFLYEKRRFIAVMLLTLISAVVYVKFSVAILIDTHPPLRILPVTLAGVFPGVSAFRAQGLIGIFILSIWVFEKEWPIRNKLLFLVAALSLPVVFFNTAIVEFSIWVYVLNVIFLITIMEKNRFNEKDLILFAIAISLCSLIRQTAIVNYALLIVILYISRDVKRFALIDILLISLPVLLFLFTTKGISPATYVPTELFLDVPAGMSSLERLLYSILPNNINYLWATSGIILPLSFVVLLVQFCYYKKNYLIIFMILGWFVIYWCLFHLIRPVLWGVPRYQMEYTAPIIMAGAFVILGYKGCVRSLLAIMVAFNFYSIVAAINNMKNYHVDYGEYYKGETPYLSEIPFNINSEIKRTFAECDGGEVRFSGVVPTYGNFPLILSGITVGAYYFPKHRKFVCDYNLQYGEKNGGNYNSRRNTTVIFSKK